MIDASAAPKSFMARARTPTLTRLLRLSLLGTLALAPLEGYLLALNGSLGKAAPALFVLTWGAQRVLGGRPLGVSHPVVWCAISLLALVLISAATHLNNGFAVIYSVRWFAFLVLVVAMVDVLTHEVHPWTALVALALGASASAVGAIVSVVILGHPRASGPLSDPNDLAYVLTAALPIVIVAFRSSGGFRRSLLLVFAMALLLLGAASTLSRGGVTAISAILIWTLARGLVGTRLLVATAGLLLLVLVGLPLLVSAPAFRQDLAQKRYIAHSNVQARQLRWIAAARMLGDEPLLGLGPGGFRSGYVRYGNFAELAAPTPVVHNMYLEVGSELGLPALTLFLGGIIAAIVASETAIRVRRADQVRPADRLLLAGLAVQGSLLAVCVSSIFVSEEYSLALWAGLSIAGALELRARRAD